MFGLVDLAYIVDINGKLAAIRCSNDGASLSDEMST